MNGLKGCTDFAWVMGFATALNHAGEIAAQSRKTIAASKEAVIADMRLHNNFSGLQTLSSMWKKLQVFTEKLGKVEERKTFREQFKALLEKPSRSRALLPV